VTGTRQGQPRPVRRTAPAVLAVLTAVWASGGAAQGLQTGAGLLGRGDSSQPIAIEADEGIEWQQQKQLYIARGNAKATRGDVTLTADTLTAFYRKSEDDSNQIWRLEANGRVHIVSPTEKVWAERGIYDVDNGVLVLTGGNLKLETQNDRLTASESLEYWDKRQMAVARGDATALRGDQRVKAAVISAQFRTDPKGELQLTQVEAFDNVEISTPKATARSAYGVYDATSSVARLAGTVKISRGSDHLAGNCAEMNMTTGVSRIFACPVEGGAGSVRGVFQPQDDAKDKQ